MGLLRNRRLRRRFVRQSSPGVDEWRLSHFPMTDENLTTMKRYLAKPRDCVINSMELLNIVDSRVAAVMRVLVGDIGITIDQIILILGLVYIRPFRPIYIGMELIDRFFEFVNNDVIFPRSRAIFVALRYRDGDGHMITIGKSVKGELVYLDAQNPTMCDMNMYQCKESIFRNVVGFTIIEYTEPRTLEAAAPEPMTDETY